MPKAAGNHALTNWALSPEDTRKRNSPEAIWSLGPIRRQAIREYTLVCAFEALSRRSSYIAKPHGSMLCRREVRGQARRSCQVRKPSPRAEMAPDTDADTDSEQGSLRAALSNNAKTSRCSGMERLKMLYGAQPLVNCKAVLDREVQSRRP